MSNEGSTNIVDRINAAYGRYRAAVPGEWYARHCIEVGRLLNEAKVTVPAGSWRAWVEWNCKFVYADAIHYMRIARFADASAENGKSLEGLSVRKIDRLLGIYPFNGRGAINVA